MSKKFLELATTEADVESSEAAWHGDTHDPISPAWELGRVCKAYRILNHKMVAAISHMAL
jgi:hypothetical protein